MGTSIVEIVRLRAVKNSFAFISITNSPSEGNVKPVLRLSSRAWDNFDILDSE